MEYDLNKNISDYPSSLQMEHSIEKLLEHSKNKNKFRINPFLASTGGRDCSDYTNKSIKRSKFAQKIFYGTTFKIQLPQEQILYTVHLIIVNLLMQIFRNVHF